jgi:MFS family permease
MVPETRSPLRRALGWGPFRRFFAARTISQWGDIFNSVAIVIVVFRVTGSGLKVGATVAFEVAPVLLLGFLAGVVVDRLPRAKVMVASDLGRSAIAVVLALWWRHLAVVYGAAFGLSAFTVFFNPAASSVVPALVAGEEDVVGANSAVWSAAVLSQIALAPVAGWLVAVAGAGWAFGINAVSFVVSAAFLRCLQVPGASVELPAGRRRREEMLEGLRAIRASRFLSVLAAVQTLAALSAGATSALLVVLSSRHLRVGPARFGVLIAAIGVGAGLGPLVLQKVVRNVRRAGWLFGPYVLRGGTDLVLAASRSFPIATGALAAYGIGTSTGNVTYNSLLQTGVPDRIRGRVFACYDVVWQTARLVSIGLGGVTADAFGITTVYLAGGALLVAAGAIGVLAAGKPPEPSEQEHGAL